MRLYPEDYELRNLTPPEPWGELMAESNEQIARFDHERRLRAARALFATAAIVIIAGMALYWLFS